MQKGETKSDSAIPGAVFGNDLKDIPKFLDSNEIQKQELPEFLVRITFILGRFLLSIFLSFLAIFKVISFLKEVVLIIYLAVKTNESWFIFIFIIFLVV